MKVLIINNHLCLLGQGNQRAFYAGLVDQVCTNFLSNKCFQWGKLSQTIHDLSRDNTILIKKHIDNNII